MSRRPARRGRARHHDTVPLGMPVIIAVFVGALAFLAYSWHQDGLRLPLTTNNYILHAQITDAAGLAANNEPPVAVAGVPLGRVVDVDYENGTANVTMRLDSRARGRVFRDAVVRVRPQNGTNVLAVDIRPGTPGAGALGEDATIPASQAESPVSPAEAISTLDADTQAFLTIILSESGEALDRRGGDLSAVFRSVAKAMDPAAEIAATLSRRRELVSELVADVDVIFGTLARRREQLRAMVRNSQAILATTASREREIAAALRAAPRVLDEADRTFAVAADVTPRISRTFDAMLPVTEKLEPSMRAARSLLPAMTRLLTATERFARDAEQPTADATKVLAELEGSKASIELIAARLDTITGAFAAQKNRIPAVAEMVSGMFGQQDDRSALGRTLIEKLEDPKPQNFGLPDTPAGRRALRRELPRALEPICGELTDSCTDLILTGELPEGARGAARP